MMRLIILAVIAVILVMLLARLFPQLRARLRGVLGSPFVRQILFGVVLRIISCLLYTSPSPRDLARSRMPSSA